MLATPYITESPERARLKREAAGRAVRLFWTGVLVAALMGLISIGVDGLQLPLIENIKLFGLDIARSVTHNEVRAQTQTFVVLAIDDRSLADHDGSISAVSSDDVIADIVTAVRKTQASVLVIDLDLTSAQRAGAKLESALCASTDNPKCDSRGLKIIIPRLLSTNARRSHKCTDRRNAPGMAPTAFRSREKDFGSVYFGSVEFEVDTDDTARSFCTLRRVQSQDGRSEAQEWLPSVPLLAAALAKESNSPEEFTSAESAPFRDAIVVGAAARTGAAAAPQICEKDCREEELNTLIDLPGLSEFSPQTPWPGLIVIPASSVSSKNELALPPGSIVFLGTTHKFARDSVRVSRTLEAEIPGVIALAYATRSILAGRKMSESPGWHHILLEGVQVALVLAGISIFSYFVYRSRLGAVITAEHEHATLWMGFKKLSVLMVVTLMFIVVATLLVIVVYLGGAISSREALAAGYQLDFTIPVLAISVEIVARTIQFFEQMADVIYEAAEMLIKKKVSPPAAAVAGAETGAVGDEKP